MEWDAMYSIVEIKVQKSVDFCVFQSISSGNRCIEMCHHLRRTFAMHTFAVMIHLPAFTVTFIFTFATASGLLAPPGCGGRVLVVDTCWFICDLSWRMLQVSCANRNTNSRQAAQV